MNNGMNAGLLQGLCPVTPNGVFDSAACFIATWEIPVFLTLVALAAAGLWFLKRQRETRPSSPPPLVFPLDRSRSAPERRPPPPRRSPPSSPPAATPAPENEDRRPSAAEPESASPEPARIQYERPPDGTLQLLPGRLIVEQGRGTGEELRFVRVPGAPPEVTIGRDGGPEYRHIQLESPTVSRTHARLRFDGTRWFLRNESSTNPTRVNERVLSSEAEEVSLADGDRVEIGEIAFRFRHDGWGDRLPLRSSWYTDRGRRTSNQDAVMVRTLEGGRELAVVCDGMGSHQAGGVASHRALDGLVESLNEGLGLEEAVRAANRAVLEAAAESEDHEGIGTTLVALLRDGDRYAVANVGDSRAYRLGPDGIERLTVDHSFVAEAMREGGMSEAEAERSPWRNAVTRNLGASESVEVDVFPGFDATSDHVVLLCTDGVHGMLSDEAIEEVCRDTPDIRDLARSLAEKALVRGGEDNVAVAALRFGGEGRPGSSGLEA